MGKSISLDIAALILLVILLISCIFRKMTSGRSNRIFIIIMLTAIASTLFDIATVIVGRMQGDHTALLYVVHTGYLVTHYLSAPFHLIFVISLTDTWHKLRKHIGLQLMLVLPLLVTMLAFVTNFSNHLVFSVENGYTRGPLFVLLYVTTVLYVIYDIVYIILYHKLFDFGKLVTVGAVIPIAMMAMVVQMLFPGMLLEMFAGAVSLLIVSIGIQRPEDYIDSFTKLIKFSAYTHDMKRNYYNDKHVDVIMINIGNYHTIQQMIGFDDATQMLKWVADNIREINKKMHGHADLYYLDNGRYRMVFEEKYQDRVERIAEALNQKLKRTTSINGLAVNLTPFIVLAKCPEEISEFKMLMSFGADFHMKNYYTGKIMKAGEIYNQNQLDIQNNIDAIIDRALEEESFQVYYQPIYSVQRGRFISAEALIRLIDPQHGFVSPETLITAAEQSGAIHKIGEIVFEKVCQFIASDDFKNSGLDYIEINLSVVQIMNNDLPERLLSIMDRYAISPENINLEITETAAAYAQRVMTENLEKLVQAGFSFSLDDYGTGYSNVRRVIQLPVKLIKLDKSFVDEDDNPKMWIVLENTIKMLKAMDMEIVVEGIETQEMLDTFTELQCDFIQGYFFSRPIPRKDFVAFIANANKAS